MSERCPGCGLEVKLIEECPCEVRVYQLNSLQIAVQRISAVCLRVAATRTALLHSIDEARRERGLCEVLRGDANALRSQVAAARVDADECRQLRDDAIAVAGRHTTDLLNANREIEALRSEVTRLLAQQPKEAERGTE